ncbi:MAG: HIRAN domain-containing protein [Tannerella sp.]|jgi:hypothetical protein|nr:HIRAN domain-containing protein [Tannerella sp.]
MKDRNLDTFHIAGFTYYDGIDVMKELEIGTWLTVVAEPENRHDPSAVAIYYKEVKLGFVPRDKNSLIRKLLDCGHDIFETRINRISPEEYPEKQIGVIVRIKDRSKNDLNPE